MIMVTENKKHLERIPNIEGYIEDNFSSVR